MFPSLRSDVVVPAAGIDFVPTGLNDFSVTEPGGKCVHGVYIPANQEDQDGSDFCDICTSLKTFCKKIGLLPQQANIRVYIWQNYSHDEAVTKIQRLEEEQKQYGRSEDSNSDNPSA